MTWIGELLSGTRMVQSFPGLLTASAGVLVVSVLGTVMTILAVLYRRSLWAYYRQVQTSWNQLNRRLPGPLHWFVQVLVLLLGGGLVLAGLVLIPLPGPGALITLGGIALLDLEFNWIVPTARGAIQRLPAAWRSSSLEQGIQAIDRE